MKNNGSDIDNEVVNIFEQNKFECPSNKISLKSNSKLENKNSGDIVDYDVSDDSLNGFSLPSVSAPASSR